MVFARTFEICDNEEIPKTEPQINLYTGESNYKHLL